MQTSQITPENSRVRQNETGLDRIRVPHPDAAYTPRLLGGDKNSSPLRLLRHLSDGHALCDKPKALPPQSGPQGMTVDDR